MQIRHVLCAIDFSEISRHALDYAIVMARWYGARVSVLHVHQLSPPVYGAPYVGPEALEPIVLAEVERRELAHRLDAYVAEDRSTSGTAIDTLLDEALNVPAVILSRARSEAADLIVIGTHGRSGFQRLVLGSVAEKVLRQACCPVLTVPPRAPDAVPRSILSVERILCPVDFSGASNRALVFAGSLAEQTHAHLSVLHVLELPPDLSDPPYSGIAEFRHDQFQRARRVLADTVKELVPPTCPVQQLLLVGRSYREILRVAAEQGADLIAIGVQGRSAADMMFFGSTTNHVVRTATCPVLTVRDTRPQ
jgi:nucleotide-binding universal stress UspA family protein